MKVGAFKRITVAVDGSPASEAGVRCALSLAGDDTTLFFCRVVDPASAVRDIPFKAPLSPAELHAAARAACEDGVRKGSHGRTGIARAVVGSTAEEVIRLSDVPVAVAHADDMLRAGPIAVAIDASDAADAALTIGIELARAVPCELHLFHVFGRADLKYIDALEHASLEAAAVLEEAADRARSSGVAFESSMLEGNPAQELLEALDRHQCASAVVGTHGASELDRLLFGSVAFALVERARVPIFVVRQAERATS